MGTDAVVVRATADVARESVWGVIADPDSYSEWVSGTRASRRGTGRWPERGAVLQHSWGLPMLRISDVTTVTDVEPGHRLHLLARLGPLARVRVAVTLADTRSGCTVEITETICDGPFTRLPAATLFQRWRNRRSVRALVALARLRADSS